MKFLTENMKAIVWFIDRVGVPLLVCGFLAYLIWVKFENIEASLRRSNRYEIAIMKKLRIDLPKTIEVSKADQ